MLGQALKQLYDAHPTVTSTHTLHSSDESHFNTVTGISLPAAECALAE